MVGVGRVAGEWLSVTEPRISRDFRFRKHAWFKWYPCNLIALFVNDICYVRIISPCSFHFFFPEMELESLEFRWMKRFFFFLTPLSGNLEIPFYSTVHCLESWRNFFVLFSFFFCDGEIEPNDRLTKYGEQLSKKKN